MRSTLVLMISGLVAPSLAGCGFSVKVPAPATPVAHVAPPAPGQRQCVEYGEDMFGRRYCARFVSG